MDFYTESEKGIKKKNRVWAFTGLYLFIIKMKIRERVNPANATLRLCKGDWKKKQGAKHMLEEMLGINICTIFRINVHMFN